MRRLPAFVIALALLWLVGAGLCGIAQPLIWGHDGFHIGEHTVQARNIARFGDLSPSNWPGHRGPPSRYYYTHRFPGYVYVFAAAQALGGFSPTAPRAQALLACMALVLALVRLVRRAWGDVQAAAAAALLVTLPYFGWFANLPDEGVPGLIGILMALGSYVRFAERGRRRDAALTIVWLAAGVTMEWTPCFVGAALFAHAVFRAWRGRHQDRATTTAATATTARFGRFALALALALAVLVAVFLLWVWRLGMLGEFRTSAEVRSAREMSWAGFLTTMWNYGAAVYTKLGVGTVSAWLTLAAVRAARGRARTRDIAPLSLAFLLLVLILALPQYVTTHIYLNKAGAPLVALCAMDLAWDLAALTPAAWRRIATARARAGASAQAGVGTAAALALVAAFVANAAPAFIAGLREGRQRGAVPLWPGNFDPQLDRMEFARLVARVTAPRTLVYLYRFSHRYEYHFYADRDFEKVPTLAGIEAAAAKDGNAVLVLDRPAPGPDEVRFADLVRTHAAYNIGGQWLIDLRTRNPAIHSFGVAQSKAALPAWRRYLMHPAYAPVDAFRLPGKEAEYARTFGVK